MKLLEEIKSHSSKWVKTKDERLANFYWQDGYGAFSVNPKEVETVIQYIANQKAHHTKRTFQEEYRLFLKQYNVPYDERYVWDYHQLDIPGIPALKGRYVLAMGIAH